MGLGGLQDFHRMHAGRGGIGHADADQLAGGGGRAAGPGGGGESFLVLEGIAGSAEGRLAAQIGQAAAQVVEERVQLRQRGDLFAVLFGARFQAVDRDPPGGDDFVDRAPKVDTRTDARETDSAVVIDFQVFEVQAFNH